MPSITSNKKQTSLLQVLGEAGQGAAFAIPKPGEVVEGKVIEKRSRRILVDLGRYGAGVVYGGEIKNAREMVKNLKAGDEVFAKVIDPDNEEGYVELSISEAGRQKAWDELLDLKEKDEVLRVRPAGFNKGGLIIEMNGISGFLPLSQLSHEHYPKVPEGDKIKIIQELQKLLKEELQVKILDVSPKMNKLIFSERLAIEEGAKELAMRYEVGQVVEGMISGVASFGAFMRFTDNPAVEGLIHISELDHRLVENSKEVVAVDEVVKAKIIEIKEGRIYLSLKALKEDPWIHAAEKYHAGDEVRGTVYLFNPFGAVIDLGEVQGHIHVTEFGSVEEMKRKLELKKHYDFIVTAVKPEERRIYLKLK